ncbi:MAG TPA: polyketide synthase dehydratase domain-containing protein, partial [Kribbellaceae bacterium]
TVRFATGIATAAAQGVTVFQELGPHPVLLATARQCLDDTDPEQDKVWLPSLRRGRDDWQQLLTTIADLHTRGVPVDWANLFPTAAGPTPTLPTYPFQRQRYWHTPRPRRTSHNTNDHPLLGRQLRTPSLRDTVFEAALSAESHPLLAEHRINGQVVVPGAHHLAMLLAAAGTAAGAAGSAGSTGLRDVVFAQPLILPDAAEHVVQTVLAADGATMRLVSYAESAWTEYATALLDSAGEPRTAPPDRDAAQARCARTIDELSTFYETVARAGLELGPSFRWLADVRTGDGEAVSRIRVPDQLDATVPYPIHPGLLDACFQLLGLTRPVADDELPVFVPFSVERLWIGRRPGTDLWAHAEARPDSSGDATTIVGDVRVVDRSGAVVVEVAGLRLKQVDPAAMRIGPARHDDLLHEVVWRAAAPADDAAAPADDTAEPGDWLIFADERGLGRQVAAALEAEGNSCTLVRPGASFGRAGSARYTVDPHDRDDFLRLLDTATTGDLRGVLFLWPLD